MPHRVLILAVLVSSLVSAFVAAVLVNVLDDDMRSAPAITQSDEKPRAVASESETARQVYEQTSEAVVHVSASVQGEPDFLGNNRSGVATGSGFVIDDAGHVVTNAHVIDGANKVTVSFPKGKEYETEIIGVDASSDLAVLQIKAQDNELDDLAQMKFADSDDARVGDFVIAIGNPLALDYTATTGIISALDREISAPNGFVIDGVLQTDAAINQGNSGGPLLDSNGNVLGVNSQIATSGTSSGSIGIGFAIPANTVSDVAMQLISNGVVKRAFLGVSGLELTENIATAFDTPVKEGVLIMQITEGSPADRAGLRAGDQQVMIGGQTFILGGDILTQIGKEKVTSMQEVSGIIDDLEVGERVRVTYYRDGKRRQTDVELAARPQDRS